MTIDVSENLLKKVKRAAKKARLSQAEFVRQTLNEKCRKG